MGDFHPFSVDHSTGQHKSKTDFTSEDRPFLQESFVNTPPEASWSDFRQKYCHRRSVCFVVLAALIPFILLRITFFYDGTISSLFQASAPTSSVTEEHLSSHDPAISPGPDSDAQSAIVAEGSQIRPDEDAWTTHDTWYNRSSGPRVNSSKDGDEGKRASDTYIPTMGLPEDNDDQELEDWELYDPEPSDDDRERTGKPPQERVQTKDPDAPQVSADKAGEEKMNVTILGEDDKQMDTIQANGTVVSSSETKTNRTDDGLVGADETVTIHSNTSKEGSELTECDLFEGDWEPDPQGPLYTNATCFYIQEAQNCMRNGRQDTDYLYWRWKPRDCDLPRFDAVSFLEMFRGKTLGFIGDSIARNQMQSLQCMLSQVQVPIETYQAADDQTVRWLYQEYNVTVAVVWSPYLLKHNTQGFKEYRHPALFLDVLDSAWTSVLEDFDVVIFSIGQWFLKSAVYVKQDEAVGCHYCPGLNLTELGFEESYRLAVREVLGKAVKDFKGIAVMSTFAISHFEGGEWDSGGKCDRRQPLDREEGLKFPGMHNSMHAVVMEEFTRFKDNNSTIKWKDGFYLDLLDVTKVGLRRADGHPGPYRQFHPFAGKSPGDFVQYDCLHWCIPGPADSWNQLLVEIVKRHL